MSFKRKIILFSLIFLLVGAGFGSGYHFGKSRVICEVCKPEEVNFSLFWQVWKLLQENFVDKSKLDTQKMIYGAISGMVKSLGDPYTVFFPPAESKRFEEDVQGAFEGVGMEVDIKKEQLVVVSPLEGTPAERAGLRAGDKILEINGTSTADLTLDEAVKLIRGPKGTEVILTILRKGWEKSQDFKIVRDLIEIPSLTLEFKDDNIAYIKLSQFSEKAIFDFSKAAIDILNSPAKKIILDLRNNPGGYLEVAQNIAGWFLERGEIVVIEDFNSEENRKEYRAEGLARLLEYPIVVLMNQGSASASEILAGALRDNRGIKLIGEKSFGKGSVQELEKLGDNSSIKITVARWLTPKGDLITEKGLEPDIKVEISDKDIEDGKDPQLDKAVEILKELK